MIKKKKIKNPLSLSDSTTRDYNRQGKDEKGEWKKRRQTEGLKIEKGEEWTEWRNTGRKSEE